MVKSDVFAFLRSGKKPYNVIFADPPYDMGSMADIPAIVFENKLLEPEGWLIIEHSADTDFSQHERLWDQRKYGNTIFSIFTQ